MTQPAPRADLRAPEIAARLVSARLDARALDAYPGLSPATLEEGYLVQEMAIHLWPDEIAGWKIGLVPPALRETLKSDRVAGPIFSRAMRRAGGSVVEFPVFEGGFAAVEAEFVFRMGQDAPAGKTSWTSEEAMALVAGLHVGVETAGSPMSFINDMGPTAVASDFGNNFGLILGGEIDNWRKRLNGLRAKTEVDGKEVGEGTAMSLPGGPMAGLIFLLSHLAQRGRPLRAGQYVSSGAVTGVHDIIAGQTANVSFGPDGQIACRAVKAQPAGAR